jgi:hypothetical protein
VLLAATINRAVDEELDLLLDRFVNEGFALSFFGIVSDCRLRRG